MNTVNVGTNPPYGIPKQKMSAAFNNAQANAMALGDVRGAMKRNNLIRPGLSVGRGQVNEAANRGASDMANGIADAYSQNLQQNAYNANLQLQGNQANQQYALALAGLQQQAANAARSEALQRQTMLTNFLGGLLR